MPIVQDDFRTQTLTSEQDLIKKQLEIYEMLSPIEKEFFLQFFANENKINTSLDEWIYYASVHEYERIPVSMYEFLHNPDYLGEIGKNIFQPWKDDLIELFEARIYTNAIFMGGIGSGKSTVSTICLLRMLYEASCLKDPARTYGLASGSNITLAILAPNERVARETVFEQMWSMMRQSPYFMDEFPPLNRAKERFKSNGLQFRKNLNIVAGSSTDSAILGKNVIGGFIDELNFFQKEALSRRQHSKNNRYGIDTKAGILYDKLMRRMKSRFMRNGKMPGILIAATSKGSDESIAERIVREAYRKQDLTFFIRDRSVLDLKKDQFSDKKFKVIVGNERYRSRILEEGDTDIPEDAKIVEIPEDLRPDFEADIDQALRDLAGISTIAMSTFIRYPEKVYACIDEKRKHPFICPSNNNIAEWDSYRPYTINWSALTKRTEDGGFAPLYYPHAKRHVHLDPGLTNDAFAITIACIAGLRKIERYSESSEPFYDFLPVYHVDFMLRIVGKPGMEVNFQNVRNLLYQFADHGFHFSLISTDKFQSRDMIQTLEAKGFKTQIVSVDESRDAYDVLKTAIYDQRISYYKHDHFLNEIVRLEDNGIKIDHLPGQSKDLCDSLAGVLLTLSETAYWNEPLMIEKSKDISKENNELDPDTKAAFNLNKQKEDQKQIEGKVYKKGPKVIPPSYNKNKSLELQNSIDSLIQMG